MPALRVVDWRPSNRRNGIARGPSGHNPRLLEWLLAENADLRNKATDLALQIQALRESSNL